MTYVSLIFSEEAAASCIRELGILGCIQFTDLNPELTPFQRRYVALIKRCDEIERKIRYVHGEVKKMDVPVQPAGSVSAFVESYDGQDGASGAYLLESLEQKLESYEQQLVELNKYNSKLSEEFSHKVGEYFRIGVAGWKVAAQGVGILLCKNRVKGLQEYLFISDSLKLLLWALCLFVYVMYAFLPSFCSVLINSTLLCSDTVRVILTGLKRTCRWSITICWSNHESSSVRQQISSARRQFL